MTVPVRAAIKKISASGVLFGILAGILGTGAGLVLGFTLGAALATVFHVSSFEGEAGYFAAAIALIVTLLVAPAAIIFTLYWRGVRGLWLLVGLVAVGASLFAIAALGFGIWYAGQPHVLNPNGPTPLLEFEVKPPPGESLESLTEVQPELDTDRNSIPGYWRTAQPQNSQTRVGYVELYLRTSQRLLVLKFPGREDRVFRLRLPASPLDRKYHAWSDWQNPDFTAKGGQQPSRFSAANEYQIRYRVNSDDL